MATSPAPSAPAQTMQGLATFSCSLSSFFDEFARMKEASSRQEEDSDRLRRKVAEMEEASALAQERLEALGSENRLLRGQVDYLKRRDGDQVDPELVADQQRAATPGGDQPTTETFRMMSVEEIKRLERDRCHMQQSLSDLKQRCFSLQREVEGRSAIVDALSKEVSELQEILSKGLANLTDTKKHVCDLSKTQYDNILGLKRVARQLEEARAREAEMQAEVAQEREEKEAASRAAKDSEWALLNCRSQMGSLMDTRRDYEALLAEKDRDKTAYSRIDLESKQISLVLEALENRIADSAPNDQGQDGDACPLAITLKISVQ